jgi:hypothetical protein
MFEYRKKFDADEKFKTREEILQVLQGSKVESKETPKTEDLAKLLEDAKTEYREDPSRTNRLKKIWAAALLRDHKYGNFKYKFMKGVGLSGLFVENYQSAVKIRSIE